MAAKMMVNRAVTRKQHDHGHITYIAHLMARYVDKVFLLTFELHGFLHLALLETLGPLLLADVGEGSKDRLQVAALASLRIGGEQDPSFTNTAV